MLKWDRFVVSSGVRKAAGIGNVPDTCYLTKQRSGESFFCEDARIRNCPLGTDKNWPSLSLLLTLIQFPSNESNLIEM
jgi:hypothetical protein